MCPSPVRWYVISPSISGELSSHGETQRPTAAGRVTGPPAQVAVKIFSRSGIGMAGPSSMTGDDGIGTRTGSFEAHHRSAVSNSVGDTSCPGS